MSLVVMVLVLILLKNAITHIVVDPLIIYIFSVIINDYFVVAFVIDDIGVAGCRDGPASHLRLCNHRLQEYERK